MEKHWDSPVYCRRVWCPLGADGYFVPRIPLHRLVVGWTFPRSYRGNVIWKDCRWRAMLSRPVALAYPGARPRLDLYGRYLESRPAACACRGEGGEEGGVVRDGYEWLLGRAVREQLVRWVGRGFGTEVGWAGYLGAEGIGAAHVAG